jgi:DNA-binding transcriptional LysR family regulator
MNWDDYDVFCHVIEHRGFTAAALAMERPKSSVSAAVGRLEAALGVRLLERTTRQLRLTEPGQALHDNIAALFMGLHEARSDALAQGHEVTGTLRLGGPHEFCTYQLAPVACRMMARYPKLKVRIDVEDDTIHPVQHHYDIAFTRLDGALPAESLVQRRVISLELGLFASPELLQRQGVPATPAALAGLPLLCTVRDLQWTFTAADGTQHSLPTLAPRLSSSNTDVRRQAAVAGLGVVRLPIFFAEAAVRAGQLRRVLAEQRCPPLQVFALLPAKRLMPAKARLFLDELDLHVAQWR